MPSRISARRVVSVSFWVDVLDVVTNLVVMLLTGSAVIFSEMAQGVADALGLYRCWASSPSTPPARSWPP